jgi:hypothetical protein
VASSSTVPSEIGEPRGPPWLIARAEISQATRHHLLIRGHLRVLGDERDPICPLIAVEIGHRKWVTWTAFSGALARRTSPATTV